MWFSRYRRTRLLAALAIALVWICQSVDGMTAHNRCRMCREVMEGRGHGMPPIQLHVALACALAEVDEGGMVRLAEAADRLQEMYRSPSAAHPRRCRREFRRRAEGAAGGVATAVWPEVQPLPQRPPYPLLLRLRLGAGRAPHLVRIKNNPCNFCNYCI